MYRAALEDLDVWLTKPGRKPLVIRGARQVGKTWLVRELAEKSGRKLVELNLERNPEFARFFDEKSPTKVLRALEARMGFRISPDQSLLFVDEIQATPQILADLRWFAEEMPRLPVAAAGSLLDFVLADHTFSMPVGRISYLHLEPMSFEEFLDATSNAMLRQFIEDTRVEAEIPPLHARLAELYRDYLVVGGMPAAVSSWNAEGNLLACAETQQNLLATYRDDFSKYAGRIPSQRLDRVLSAVPRMLGRKFKYSQVDREERSSALRQALDLLCKARLCHRVQASDGAGIPLAAGTRERVFKVILLDTGLVSAQLGLSLQTMGSHREVFLVNEGVLAEQAVGQALRTVEPRFTEPALFYWAREQKGSEAELDYLVQHGAQVVPVEVKAGTSGTLKSLHMFMAMRRLPLGVRFSPRPPSLVDVDTKTTTGSASRYRLLSLPPYMAGQVRRILDTL